VVTTGSTVHAAAAALKAAGASKITVFSIAKDLELAFSNL
jgi:predicted amidophosphoribosyltransferase